MRIDFEATKTVNNWLTLIVLLVFTAPSWPQASTKSVKLQDGVERWHRVRTITEKPWFFQQVENLFNVALPSADKLPFVVSVAFLVGVSNYDNLNPDLPFVANDLSDMRDFLLYQGGFDTVYVVANQAATVGLVEEYMTNRFRKSLTMRDRLLFYFSGHGADLGGSTGYIQFSKATPDDFANHVLAVNRCTEWSRIIKAGHILFIYDCCVSGLAFTAKSTTVEPNLLITTLSGTGSRLVITAGTAEENTYEVKDTQGKGNGVFTRAFLDAALSGNTDEQKDGFITINEIFAQLEIEVKKFAALSNKQLTPRRWGLQESEYRGGFIFVNPIIKNPVLPPEISQALHTRPKANSSRGERSASVGIVQLTSYVSGKVYIDLEYYGEIISGDLRDYYGIEEGLRVIMIQSAKDTITQTVIVSKGVAAQVTIKPVEKKVSAPNIFKSQIAPLEDMVLIPGGNFQMGNDDYEADEKPTHAVYVDSFYMDIYEVTVEKYQRFLTATKHRKPWVWYSQLSAPKNPVVFVTWNDANAYAEWAGKSLPTEAQWEYAACDTKAGRGGSVRYKYTWGNDSSGAYSNFDLDSSWRYKLDMGLLEYYSSYVKLVGSYPPNSYGLYDMAGNVWEWCADLYDEKYYQNSPTNNPPGSPSGSFRVVRGGGWKTNFRNMRYTNRVRCDPNMRDDSVGFRCVLNLRTSQ